VPEPAVTRPPTSRRVSSSAPTLLVAPEPDHQQPHADDEIYVVLEGHGSLEIDGTSVPLSEGQAVFVPAGKDHRFIGYENLSVLVVFARPHEAPAS